MGVLAALLNVQRGGAGQVVDAAMIEGAAQLGAVFWGMIAGGNWQEERGSNWLDGGTPWYDTYRTSDGLYMTVGAVEGRFYAELLAKLGLADAGLPAQHDRAGWPRLREAFERRLRESYARRSGAKCSTAAMPASRPCSALPRRPAHAQHRARGSFVEVARRGAARRRRRASRRRPRPYRAAPPARGEHGAAALRDWGFDADAIARLQQQGLGVKADPTN